MRYRKTHLLETVLLLLMGGISALEGVRLIIRKDPQTAHDVLGPGGYIILVGLGLIGVGMSHFLVNGRKEGNKKETVVNKEMRKQLLGIILTLFLYIFFIDILGYLCASILFFCMILWVLGFRSLRFNLILSFSISIPLYIIFVRWLNMALPGGLLFS
jgi:magnesium-transporting ATPase (P-type)